MITTRNNVEIMPLMSCIVLSIHGSHDLLPFFILCYHCFTDVASSLTFSSLSTSVSSFLLYLNASRIAITARHMRDRTTAMTASAVVRL